MRLAVKIFLAYSLVVLVLAGIASWSLNEVAKLSAADRTLTIRAAEALRTEVALRELMVKATQLDMRNLVFGDPEYTAVSRGEAQRIEKEFERLSALLKTGAEKTNLQNAVQGFAEYQALVGKARDLRNQDNREQAEDLLVTKAQPLADRVVAELDRLSKATQSALDMTQTEATATLSDVRTEIEQLRQRTWTAVTTAMALGVILALAGTAVVTFQLTRDLSRLSEATKAVAQRKFRESAHMASQITSKDEIGTLALAFNDMADILARFDAMTEQFYATVAHELRSPLAAMLETIRVIETKAAGPVTEKQERLVAIFRKGIERLLLLVKAMLRMAQANAGMLSVEHHWFALDAAVTQAVETLRPQIEQRGITLKLEIGPNADRLLGDEDHIIQVVDNLLRNALRFTPAQGTITVTLSGTAEDVRIAVKDTGVGIPAKLLPVVFDRFQQMHVGRDGTGLGLAIVKSLVEAHGGRVTVESQEGTGSLFTVILPKNTEEDTTPRGAQRNP